MKYAIIGLCILVATVISVTIFRRTKSRRGATLVSSPIDIAVSSVTEAIPAEQEKEELVIQMEMLPVESIPDESQLVEITDSRVLAHINNLIPGMAQTGNVVNNAAQATQGAGEVLYRAIIPVGAKLTDSKAMEGAVRGIYYSADGIKGHANLVAVEAPKGTAVIANTAAAAMGVASLVVGQYYMAQIHAEFGAISDGISKISDFQDNEYRSRFFPLSPMSRELRIFRSKFLKMMNFGCQRFLSLIVLRRTVHSFLGKPI